MKKCNNCGSVYNDNVNFCATCGSANFSAFENNAQPRNNPVYNTNINANTIPNTSARMVNENGNIIAGVVGAFLFSLLGGLVYFLIYQLDIIAGISGLIIFVLANFGYNLFAKPSTIAVFPTPASPMRQGLFLFLRHKILTRRSVSESLPMTGSNFPLLAN